MIRPAATGRGFLRRFLIVLAATMPAANAQAANDAGESVGAGIAGTATSSAAGDDDDLDWDTASGSIERLPSGWRRVLTIGDASLYRQAFDAQRMGEFRRADRLLADIADKRLMGFVLAQRHLHAKSGRTPYRDLTDWLEKYADHPDADRIHALALRRKPDGARAPGKSGLRLWRGVFIDEAYPNQWLERMRGWVQGRPDRGRAMALAGRMQNELGRLAPTRAHALLEQQDVGAVFNQTAYDEAAAHIANAYFVAGKIDDAHDLAASAARRSGALVPQAGWIAGLASWRLGMFAEAAGHFRSAALSEQATPWQQSAAAFWAARSYLRVGDGDGVTVMLRQGAHHQRTFYGLLARHLLGLDPAFDWRKPPLDDAVRDRLSHEPPVARALALIEAGQRVQAERQLRYAYSLIAADLRPALLSLALDLDMAGLAMRLAGARAAETGERFDAALYPVPAWHPEDGYRIDRALIYAVVRQESRFNALAKSSAGARGLMQLMPRTASGVAGQRDLQGRARDRLYDPGFNLKLGQRYLERLIASDDIEGNLFLVAAAYNGGSGNLRRWRRNMADLEDPLLFIESIPAPETRAFVERVLVNYWIYRARFGQKSPSLDALAEGRWPLYHPLDDTRAALDRP